jgi:hypothetical protein
VPRRASGLHRRGAAATDAAERAEVGADAGAAGGGAGGVSE